MLTPVPVASKVRNSPSAASQQSGKNRRGESSLVTFEPIDTAAFPGSPSSPSDFPRGGGGASPPDAADLDGHPGASALPRRSFLLKDVLSKQPTAYKPRYVIERSSMPTERWVKTSDNPKWSPTKNARAVTPSLSVPGYAPPPENISWDDYHDIVDAESVINSASTNRQNLGPNVSALTSTLSPGIAAEKVTLQKLRISSPSLGGGYVNVSSPSKHGRPSHQASSPPPLSPKRERVVPNLVQSTPLANGVQQAWVSSHVQLGPFRNLIFYQHDKKDDDSRNAIPVNVLPPRGTRYTPLEMHRVEHAQQEYLKERHPTQTRGHVSSALAQISHIGLPDEHSIERSPVRRPLSRASTINTSGKSTSSAIYGEHVDDGHPPLHYALPPGPAMPPPPPVPVISKLPVRVSPLKKFSGACTHEQNGGGVGCRICEEIQAELDTFDNVRVSKEERLYQHQLQMWMEQQAREEEAKTIPPDMMRTKSGRLVKKLIILDEGPTVAQLYHGTTHEDREALYTTACGGLSFDISKEKFVHLMQKVLAPRIHVRVNEDQAAAMFAMFDTENKGSVSYLGYLAALTTLVLTSAQKKLLEDIFEQLYRLPFYTGDAKNASKQLQQHMAQLQLEGSGNSPSPQPFDNNGSFDASLLASPVRRKSSVNLMRRRSSRALLSPSSQDLTSPTGKGGKGVKEKPQVYLTKSHITFDRVKNVIYELKQHNPWFPHPLNDALATMIAKCFAALQSEDRVNIQKFKMFIFCDDDCMPALEALVPSE